MERFGTITKGEYEKLTRVPMYIGLLIGYADGHLEAKEEEWIEKVTLFRTKTAHSTLRKYYQDAHTVVVDHMKLFIDELPKSKKDKMEELSNNIKQVNPILNQLDERMRERLVESYQTMALSVAEISGGVLNFFSLNPDEEKWLDWLNFDAFQA